MAKTAAAKSISKNTQPAEVVGRVFPMSLQGIPRVTAQSRARLEAAARVPENTRDYPKLIVD
ncbi:hypothetical protein [Massilia genomosp. 1]|uniref:Chromosome partitioning protein ParB n=1 Tax=Massilia genomosp. 1 TaxID=2609280 RepID=A0ABX0MRA1_9BURK|nr:hypothetical protein [Massilia genomosp. 1]NHZ65273.1 hypothetical protein [Massilia genomosp. 1]